MKIFKMHNVQPNECIPSDAYIVFGKRGGAFYVCLTSPRKVVRSYIDPNTFYKKVGQTRMRWAMLRHNGKLLKVKAILPVKYASLV